MDSSQDKKRVNAEDDRLTNLPEELIHKILSFVSVKQAIEASALSPRWRHLWTSMPYLNLSTKDFQRSPTFSEFITCFFSKRNDQSEAFSLCLTFDGINNQEFVKRTLDYAFSHNVQQLSITCLPRQSYSLADFPPSLFSSQSLQTLTLTGRIDTNLITTRPTWSMPNLTTLILDGVIFFDNKYADIFSKCANLKNLTLKNMHNHSFSIDHPGLSSLTLERGKKRVNVVTPQLKNLTVKYWLGIRLVSAPNLSSLHYKDDYILKDVGYGLLELPTDLLHLEKVDLNIVSVLKNKAYTREMFYLLQRLHSVKYLALNMELIKFLSTEELISNRPSPLVNLKRLKVYIDYVQDPMSAEVKKYLLDGSPGATLRVVSHKR